MNNLDGNKLKGKNIICTYPSEDQNYFSQMICATGARVLSFPMIDISHLPFRPKHPPGYYSWLVFTSKNGVRAFYDHDNARERWKIAALGKSTAHELERRGISVHFSGSGKSAEYFAEELLDFLPAGQTILLALGTLAPETLREKLVLEHSVERVNVYRTGKPHKVDREILQRIENDQYDLIIISSPSAIRNLWSVLTKNKAHLRLVSIGQSTTAAIRRLKLEPVITASESTYKGLAEATINYFKKH